MTQPSIEQLQALEADIEQTLYSLIDLELEENFLEMNTRFAQLLAKVQAVQLIDYKLDVLKLQLLQHFFYSLQLLNRGALSILRIFSSKTFQNIALK